MSATRPRPPVGFGGPGVPKSPFQSVHHLERDLVPSTESPVEKQHARWRHHGYDLDLLGVETTVESPLHGAEAAKPDLLADGQPPGVEHGNDCRIDHFKVPAKTIGVDGANIPPLVIGDPVIDQEAKHASFLLSAPSQREPARSRPWIPTTPEAERTLPSHVSR